MPSNLTVLYNQPKEGEYFNLEYYINTHMPIVKKQWTPLGLKAWQVIKFGPGSQFYGGVLLTWENPENATSVLTAAESKPVFDDVPNFTNLTPILLPSSIEDSWELK
ncbi:hypothetical protein TARUN_2577 [Trichoderma arundinaceum]|uniref:Ethyl tert-butyl ether degradation n=1 Tax=Trichoderma arundinaceum TaxID=490622 RepID=A0A395NU89_TRIAR|nr:hypothetical protein TARUN_2577 [Trichoderma arundinaceum]